MHSLSLSKRRRPIHTPPIYRGYVKRQHAASSYHGFSESAWGGFTRTISWNSTWSSLKASNELRAHPTVHYLHVHRQHIAHEIHAIANGQLTVLRWQRRRLSCPRPLAWCRVPASITRTYYSVSRGMLRPNAIALCRISRHNCRGASDSDRSAGSGADPVPRCATPDFVLRGFRVQGHLRPAEPSYWFSFVGVDLCRLVILMMEPVRRRTVRSSGRVGQRVGRAPIGIERRMRSPPQPTNRLSNATTQADDGVRVVHRLFCAYPSQRVPTGGEPFGIVRQNHRVVLTHRSAI
jgi:hypothetical protein